MPIINYNPNFRAAQYEGTSADTTLTSGTATKGAWVQLIASTSFYWNWINLTLHDANTNNDYYTDIGIGAAGSEVVLIPDINYHSYAVGTGVTTLKDVFKCQIPIGTRISARTKATANTDTLDLNVIGTG